MVYANSVKIKTITTPHPKRMLRTGKVHKTSHVNSRPSSRSTGSPLLCPLHSNFCHSFKCLQASNSHASDFVTSHDNQRTGVFTHPHWNITSSHFLLSLFPILSLHQCILGGSISTPRHFSLQLPTPFSSHITCVAFP